MPLVATCRRCDRYVLEADAIGDEEECVRDHLLVAHPDVIQPETRAVLLQHFLVSEPPPPAAA